MSKFTKTFTETVEFDGDNVVFVLNRLTNAQMIKISPLFTQEGDVVKFSLTRKLEMIELAKQILPETVVSISGLHDANGTPLTLDEMLGPYYFSGLIDKLMGVIIINSTSQGLDTKKSAAPSPVSPPVPGSETSLTSVESPSKDG